jgi:anti-sigma factor RsiW
MNCSDYLHLLHDYFLGRLAANEQQRVDEHAAHCGECGALMARAKELSCRDFTEFLNDYVDGTLPPEKKHLFERHLEICPDCTNYLASYRATMRQSAFALGQGLDVPPAPVPEDLILAVLKATGKRDSKP